jgi:hypothetical protein
MSITTYAELQTAVADYLHRNDVSSQTADYFISIAETKLNRRLRLRAQMSTATGSVAATVALPTGFLELVSLTITTGGSTYPISYKPVGKITGEEGKAAFYTLVGSNLKFEPVDTSATYNLTYYAKFSSIEDGTNWLIENGQDIYLFASLKEAAVYVRDAEDANFFGSELENGISALESQERFSQYGNNLAMRAG